MQSSVSSGGSSVGQSWESGVVEGSSGNESSSWESCEVKSSSVRVGQSSDGGSSNNSSLVIGITSLPVSSSSLSSLEGSKVSSLGLSDLGSVLNGLRGDSGEDGGDQGLGVEGWGHERLHLGNGRDGGSDGEVGAGNSEAVDGVSDVVDGLEETVGVDVLVGPGGHSVGIAGLSAGRWTASMSERELSELILSMELGRRVRVDRPGV